MFEEQDKKDKSLDERLKEVYVTSADESILNKDAVINKPLPRERKNVDPPEFGYLEPVKVTKGKLSVRQALLLIGKHQQDPVTNTAFLLAKEHTIHPKVAGVTIPKIKDSTKCQNKMLLCNRKYFEVLQNF